jgi:hypothetical protein
MIRGLFGLWAALAALLARRRCRITELQANKAIIAKSDVGTAIVAMTPLDTFGGKLYRVFGPMREDDSVRRTLGQRKRLTYRVV